MPKFYTFLSSLHPISLHNVAASKGAYSFSVSVPVKPAANAMQVSPLSLKLFSFIDLNGNDIGNDQ
ncbi:hypothetical protein GCM10027286_03460 [Virgibacillus ainsalahensis]